MNKVKETCKILKGAWDELGKADDFSDDWYNGNNNQQTHILLGLVTGATIASCFALWFGEFPVRASVSIVFAFVFIIYIQIFRQGWNGADTIWDSYFYILGLVAVLFSFLEIEDHGTGYDFVLAAFPSRILSFILIGFISLVIYAWPRMKRQYGSHNDVN